MAKLKQDLDADAMPAKKNDWGGYAHGELRYFRLMYNEFKPYVQKGRHRNPKYWHIVLKTKWYDYGCLEECIYELLTVQGIGKWPRSKRDELDEKVFDTQMDFKDPQPLSTLALIDKHLYHNWPARRLIAIWCRYSRHMETYHTHTVLITVLREIRDAQWIYRRMLNKKTSYQDFHHALVIICSNWD